MSNDPLPVDIVLHPSWWYHNEGLVFDQDFYFNYKKRVEVEQKMEKVLYDRWGNFGLGKDHDQEIPVIGAVHLAAGFLISEMLGCKVEYKGDAAPQVIPAQIEQPHIDPEQAFKSPAFKRYESLLDNLKGKYGYVKGDINWSGVLNIALELRGENIFLDMFDKPEAVQSFFSNLASVIEKFVVGMQSETGTSSISVNRNVRNIHEAVYLHSECSHIMISIEDYEKYLLPIDIAWSKKYRPYGIHYCGADPHRYARSMAKIPHLEFLDLGWGGDIKLLRKHLTHTFFNIRLSPVEIIRMNPEEIRNAIIRCVKESANPWLTGVCCINMDHHVSDEKVTAIFETVAELRNELKLEKH